MTFTFERTWDLLNTKKKIIMKYKVFTEEDFRQLQQSQAIKEFFAEDFDANRVQNFYNVFFDELSKITIIPEDISNYQSATTAELMSMSKDLWDNMVPVDIEHKVLMNGWKSYNEVFLKTSIEKKHKDLYNAYLFTDTEKIIVYKNRDCYATADEEKYSELLRIFVDNFGFSDPEMTYKFLHSWIKIVKRGFTTKGENRNLALLFVSKNNRTGKSRLSEFIADGICEYMSVSKNISSSEKLLGRFNILPKTNGVILLNEFEVPSYKNDDLKNILGNDKQEIEIKGVNNGPVTINHNVFIGSANKFMHLRGEEDTRLLNIPLDRIKYTVKGVHDYGKQIVNLVKEILAAAPETDCDESKNIIDCLPDWNNKKGDDQEWLRDLYFAVDGDVDKLRMQLKDLDGRKITSKKALGKKIASIINVYNGGFSMGRIIDSLGYKISKFDEIFVSTTPGRYDISSDIFANVEIDDDKKEKEVSLPWSESPICRYYSQQPQPSQPQPSQPQPQIQPVSMNFEFDFEWTDPDAPADVKYEPVSFCDLFLYRPVENENDNKEENNKEEKNNTSSSTQQKVSFDADENNYFLNNYDRTGNLWDLSTIEYLEKLKCPWKK